MSRAAEELERIRLANGGKLTPEAVVEAARDESCPLHSSFQWDNDAAGHEYRLWQARHLIKTITIKDAVSRAPVYVSVKVNNEQYYQRTDVAVRNVDEWQSALFILTQKLDGISQTLDTLAKVADNDKKRKQAKVAANSISRVKRVVNG